MRNSGPATAFSKGSWTWTLKANSKLGAKESCGHHDFWPALPPPLIHHSPANMDSLTCKPYTRSHPAGMHITSRSPTNHSTASSLGSLLDQGAVCMCANGFLFPQRGRIESIAHWHCCSKYALRPEHPSAILLYAFTMTQFGPEFLHSSWDGQVTRVCYFHLSRGRGRTGPECISFTLFLRLLKYRDALASGQCQQTRRLQELCTSSWSTPSRWAIEVSVRWSRPSRPLWLGRPS